MQTLISEHAQTSHSSVDFALEALGLRARKAIRHGCGQWAPKPASSWGPEPLPHPEALSFAKIPIHLEDLENPILLLGTFQEPIQRIYFLDPPRGPGARHGHKKNN